MTGGAPRLPYAEVRRDRDPAPAADRHPGHALIPAADRLALAQPELERVVAIHDASNCCAVFHDTPT